MSIQDIPTADARSREAGSADAQAPNQDGSASEAGTGRTGSAAPSGVSRRVISLGGIGLAAVSVGLAACSSPAPATQPAESPSADDEGTTAPEAPAAAPILALADVPVGGAVAVDIEGAPSIVAQPEAGTVVAFTAICTHQGCKVTPADAKLDCPCHGSQFDAFTGAVLRGPAEAPLTAVAVAVEGDNVVKA